MSNFRIDDFKALVTQGKGMSRSNLYKIRLPAITKTGEVLNSTTTVPEDQVDQLIIPISSLDMLCKGTQLPGRQITSVDRQMGTEMTKIAYGYQVSDLNLSFYVMNDNKVRKYFDAWQRLAVDYATGDIGYFDDYALTVDIWQIRRGVGIPVYKKDLDYLDKIPSNITNRLPVFEVPGFGEVDLKQGEIDISLRGADKSVYGVKLYDAYPTSIASIDMNNDLDGLVEINVQLTFRNWVDIEEVNQGGDAGTIISTLLDKLGIF